jgi:hypothetical protein
VAGAQKRDLGLDIGKLFAAILEVNLGWVSNATINWMQCAYVFDGNNLARAPVHSFVHLSKAPACDYVS